MKVDDMRIWHVDATLNGETVWRETRSGQGSDRVILIEAKARAVADGDLTQAQADAAEWTVK